MLNSSNILVIGGGGYIGSNLCKFLVDAGHNVHSLDNYHTGEMREGNHHNYVEYINGHSKDIAEHYSDHVVNFDYIFHLGEYARVEQSFQDYDKVMEYNYHSFPKILDFARHHDAKLIYSGSSTKFSVGDEEGSAMSPYAYTKAQNTELLKNYAKWFGLDYTIVYFYNVYGGNEVAEGKYATVVAKFLNLVKSGNPILPITSPGTQLRNFTHIDDIIRGLVKAGLEGSGDGYGIGSDEKHSILDLANYLGAGIKFNPKKRGNRMDGELKTSKLKALGWEAKNNLRDYIRKSL
tara:strand:+ start:1074 stop:1949 length:876 start_codon:yes stop_codon:yes gene_type:complete